MGRDLEDTIESFGIPVTLVVGYNINSEGHLWINIFGISFDSVYLIPTPNELFYPHYIEYYEDWDDYGVE